jgi:hypothetical protein
MDIPWVAYCVEHAQVELLLGDRPVWTHRRPVDPDFMVVLPLSPRTVFVGAKSSALIDTSIAAGPSRLVRLTNETMVQAAKLRVYGRAEISFIERCVRELGGLSSAIEAGA